MGVSSMEFLPKKYALSIGRARAFNKQMTSSKAILMQRIRENLERMFDSLHAKHYEIRNITLLLIDKNWEKYRMTHEFESYSYDKQDIFRALEKLLNMLYIPELLYRKTGVFSSDIRNFDTKQLCLFESENKRFNQTVKLEDVFQTLKSKYGDHILKIGG